ncbi:DUF418 domain-containing protein [Paludibacterium paludis]|uniref:Transporter n=1 Tax=Paludibacterium paludis TaxID=1225769 RepID=A0A918P2F5_9NEIS|nr:heparan-alpha-glucosaminide N-acetyltransferase domain-containing protein [Paludibacterium paludis]GGY14349.1 transporter [Paludibacterium paludis]
MNTANERLHGLDLARCLALIGMVLVNFRLAMGADDGPLRGLNLLFGSLEGRAASIFIVLAGVGLVLGTRGLEPADAYTRMMRRAAFLAAVGLANALIFPPDIIHYYAVYFLIGTGCLFLPSSALVALTALLPLLFVGLHAMFDYEQGWVKSTYDYPDFWTPQGFVRNLLFNGWHPVVPWLAFLLWGIVLGRLPLGSARVQKRMIGWGMAIALLAWGASKLGSHYFPAHADMLGVTAMPPLPLYLLLGCGVATSVIGLSLMVANRGSVMRLGRFLVPAGRMTLTLYLAHVLIGMGTLENIGWLYGKTLPQVLVAAGVYCAAAIGFANIWSRYFSRGPVESVMRRLCG